MNSQPATRRRSSPESCMTHSSAKMPSTLAYREVPPDHLEGGRRKRMEHGLYMSRKTAASKMKSQPNAYGDIITTCLFVGSLSGGKWKCHHMPLQKGGRWAVPGRKALLYVSFHLLWRKTFEWFEPGMDRMSLLACSIERRSTKAKVESRDIRAYACMQLEGKAQRKKKCRQSMWACPRPKHECKCACTQGS